MHPHANADDLSQPCQKRSTTRSRSSRSTHIHTYTYKKHLTMYIHAHTHTHTHTHIHTHTFACARRRIYHGYVKREAAHGAGAAEVRRQYWPPHFSALRFPHSLPHGCVCVCVLSVLCMCCVCVYVCMCVHMSVCECDFLPHWPPHLPAPRYGVATVSRIDKIIGLFCRISSIL